MKRASILVFCGAVTLLVAEDPPKAIPLLDTDAIVPDTGEAPTRLEGPRVNPGLAVRGRVETASGQFGVSGGTADVRASLALQAEGERGRLHELLGLQKEAVVMPIEILLHGAPGDPPRARPLAMELRFTRDTYLLNVHVDFSRGIDHEQMRRAMWRGLIYDRSLEGVAPGGLGGPLEAPVWLVEGLLEADLWRRGAGDRQLYEGVFKKDLPFVVDEVLAMGDTTHARLDGVSREVFRVLSGALVMALLEQPGGRASLASFCGEVARFEGEMPILLRRHFPSLNLSQNGLVKWWALTLAKLADAPLTDSMSIAETERELDRALRLRFQLGGQMKQIPLSRHAEAGDLSEADRLIAIRSAQESLNRLSYRCFPSYRPLLLEYQELLVDWAGGEDEQVIEGLRLGLEDTRTIMEARALRGRDFLDYWEISGASELSGSFDDYLRLKRELAERPRVERDDPISRYLDRMEKALAPKGGR
ncbi:hypothetical protein [Haloferula sp. A504]|uniref:hypothetical protein n=1 Tax=Haloferula sp. A504 TaxID=3373601 RepID=UPI0031C62F72|nr:hypothetical protein [Verrucomicrobiaceae bacterium E54]